MATSKGKRVNRKFKFHGTFSSKEKAETVESRINDAFIIRTKDGKYSVVTDLRKK